MLLCILYDMRRPALFAVVSLPTGGRGLLLSFRAYTKMLHGVTLTIM